MKKLLLVVGILSVIACILLLIFAVLSLLGYYNVLDGSAELYNKLHQRMTISFAAGIVLAVIGAVCFIIRSKI